MKTGHLSESVSFEDKEKKVRESLSDDLIKKLDDLKKRSHKAYVEFIEKDYPNHQELVDRWEEYVDAHGTPDQINTLLAIKGTNGYPTKLYTVYRGLVNHAEEV